jgi:predicted enzyme related to lactoylglutathione lyase
MKEELDGQQFLQKVLGVGFSKASNPQTPSQRIHLNRDLINTINVDNIEQAMEEIEQNGGELITKVLFVPGIGKMAYFQDPDFNILGLVQKIS